MTYHAKGRMSYLLMPLDELQKSDALLGEASSKVSSIKLWVEALQADFNSEMMKKIKDNKTNYKYPYVEIYNDSTKMSIMPNKNKSN